MLKLEHDTVVMLFQRPNWQCGRNVVGEFSYLQAYPKVSLLG